MGIKPLVQWKQWNTSNIPDRWMIKPLIVSATGYVEIIRLLLDAGAKGTARTLTGWTPAHCAAESNRIPALRALHGAGIAIDLKDRNGDTPRRIATIYGHTDCAKYLAQ